MNLYRKDRGFLFAFFKHYNDSMFFKRRRIFFVSLSSTLVNLI
nr:MAG TPA: hypothetical protein [Caudoviricetes sp.]